MLKVQSDEIESLSWKMGNYLVINDWATRVNLTKKVMHYFYIPSGCFQFCSICLFWLSVSRFWPPPRKSIATWASTSYLISQFIIKPLFLWSCRDINDDLIDWMTSDCILSKLSHQTIGKWLLQIIPIMIPIYPFESFQINCFLRLPQWEWPSGVKILVGFMVVLTHFIANIVEYLRITDWEDVPGVNVLEIMELSHLPSERW